MMEWLILVIIALAAGGLAWTIVLSLQDRNSAKRLEMVVSGQETKKEKKGLLQKIFNAGKDDRRRKLEETLRTLEEKNRKKKRVTLRQRLQRAGLHMTTSQYIIFSVFLGAGLGLVGLLVGTILFGLQKAMIFALATAIIGGLGLPFWILHYLTQRRLSRFLDHLPDAIELMVRGLRSGLPVNEAIKTIAEEVPDPVGPEFLELVEGQKIGITIDVGLERMYERVPLQEVNFLYIVMTIQKETGGNLSEALQNLATVLRDRRTMKLKVKAITQEAKVSAMIIGSMPFLMIGSLVILSPDYLKPLITTDLGRVFSMGAAFWLFTGIMIMRKMINFKV